MGFCSDFAVKYTACIRKKGLIYVFYIVLWFSGLMVATKQHFNLIGQITHMIFCR